MRININKGDGPSAKTLFEKLKVTVNRKGKINGAEVDGVRIIVKGTKLVYTEDAKKLSKVNEFKELVKNAELEHKKTPAALVEETLPDTRRYGSCTFCFTKQNREFREFHRRKSC